MNQFIGSNFLKRYRTEPVITAYDVDRLKYMITEIGSRINDGDSPRDIAEAMGFSLAVVRGYIRRYNIRKNK